MFILRSETPSSGCIAEPDGARIPMTNDEDPPARPEPRRIGSAWQKRGRTAPERDTEPADPTATRSGRHRRASTHMPLFAAAFAVRFGGATAALECPKHFADVQALIDKVGASVERARHRMPEEGLALVRALLDDARTMLRAAKQNHEQPQGAYDHARAYAKADAALGHARAAEIVCSRSTQE